MLIRRNIKCKFSEKAKQLFYKYPNPDRTGTIVRENGVSYRVVWDGQKTFQAFHKSLIEKIK